MKNILVVRRWPAWLAVCCAVPLCALCINVARAAERPARVPVAEQQIAALGIRTLRLEKNTADAVSVNYPAQVVVPPNAEYIVSAPLGGMVTRVLAEHNQTVARGAPLLRIASPELGQWQMTLLQAQARATLARQAAAREQGLFGEGIVPQRRLQEAQTALAEAEAALRQAKSALRLAGMDEATIAHIAASGDLHDTVTLNARQAGLVSEINVKPGQQVDAVTPLLRIVQTDVLWLEIKAPASDRAQWQAGARLTVAGHPAVAATLLQGPGAVVPSTQSMTVYARVDKTDGSLRLGELTSVGLPLRDGQSGVWDIPLAAVIYDGAQAYVFVRDKDGFTARPVRVLASAGQRVRVQGGLQAGDGIAIAGVAALKSAWLTDAGAP